MLNKLIPAAMVAVGLVLPAAASAGFETDKTERGYTYSYTPSDAPVAPASAARALTFGERSVDGRSEWHPEKGWTFRQHEYAWSGGRLVDADKLHHDPNAKPQALTERDRRDPERIRGN